MTVPDRPDPDALIETDWGRWAHDEILDLRDAAGPAGDGLPRGWVNRFDFASASYNWVNGQVISVSNPMTALANRWYRTTWKVPNLSASGALDTWQFALVANGNDVGYSRTLPGSTAGVVSFVTSFLWTVGTGFTGNIQLRTDRITGSGTYLVGAVLNLSVEPIRHYTEDLGPA